MVDDTTAVNPKPGMNACLPARWACFEEVEMVTLGQGNHHLRKPGNIVDASRKDWESCTWILHRASEGLRVSVWEVRDKRG